LLIAKAMVHQPPILVLDEPTAGVDVELRKNLWDNVKALNKEGVTIILTTHYLFEAQEMCDRIAIIDKGNLVALDTTQKLLDRILTKKITFKVSEKNNTKNLALSGVQFAYDNNDIITAIYEKNSFKFEDVANVLKKKNIEILDITTEDGDLEDVFVQLTNN
jgi:ABC-2 type transport system ATP-binding protein